MIGPGITEIFMFTTPYQTNVELGVITPKAILRGQQ
jgi:hypothetical protein